MTRAIFRILSLISLVLVQLSSTAAAPAPDTFVTLVDPIAGSDLFPIPASVVGVDAQGRTTFAYAVTATTTTELEIATLTEHVTIVAATNYFSVKDELAGPGGTFAVAAACTQQGNGAVCTATGPDPGETQVLTVPAASLGTLVLDIPSTPVGQPSSVVPSAPAGQPSSVFPSAPAGQPSSVVPSAPAGQPSSVVPSAPGGKASSASRRASVSNPGGVVVMGLVGITLGLIYQLI